MIVEILTPEKKVFTGEAKAVRLPGVDGSLGVLNNHAPLITTLKKGDLVLTLPGGEKQTIAVKGGTVEVQNNKMIILAE